MNWWDFWSFRFEKLIKIMKIEPLDSKFYSRLWDYNKKLCPENWSVLHFLMNSKFSACHRNVAQLVEPHFDGVILNIFCNHIPIQKIFGKDSSIQNYKMEFNWWKGNTYFNIISTHYYTRLSCRNFISYLYLSTWNMSEIVKKRKVV